MPKPMKLAMSFNTRRIRLGVTHHGAPAGWVAPEKPDPQPPRDAKLGKRRR